MPAPPRKTTTTEGVTHVVQHAALSAPYTGTSQPEGDAYEAIASDIRAAATRTSGSTPQGQGRKLPPRKLPAPPVAPTQDALDAVLPPTIREQDVNDAEEDDDISDLLGTTDDEDEFDIELRIPEAGEQPLPSFLCVGGPWGGAMYTPANKNRRPLEIGTYGAKGSYSYEQNADGITVLKWTLYPGVTQEEARTHYGQSHYVE